MTRDHARQATSKRYWLAGLTALVAVALLTGCTLAKPKTAGAAAPAPAAAADPDHPLALFLGQDLGLIDYAQLRLRNQCLAKAGYPQNLDVMQGAPRVDFDNLIITPRTFGPTTEQEARRIGFGLDQPAEPPAVVAHDTNYDKAMDDCSKKAWQQLGVGAQQTYLAYFDLGNKLSGALIPTITSRLDPQLPAKMLSCMQGKGYHADDQQAFLRTPRPQLFGVRFGDPDPGPGATWEPDRTKGGVQVGPGALARQYHASPEEGALAVAWLQCRQQTGLAEQQMIVAVQVQEELVAKYETTFDELNPQIRMIAKQASALIGAR